jgi:hypothetical protein
VLYRAIRGLRKSEPLLVIMLLTFIIPCTVMYAMSMSNIGLIARQRLVIVAACSILAAINSPKMREAVVPARRPLPRRAAKAAQATSILR